MTTTSIKLMLLGLGLIAFSYIFPPAIAQLSTLSRITARTVASSPYELEVMTSVMESLCSLAGLILLFVGFFRREKASAA